MQTLDQLSLRRINSQQNVQCESSLLNYLDILVVCFTDILIVCWSCVVLNQHLICDCAHVQIICRYCKSLNVSLLVVNNEQDSTCPLLYIDL